MSIDFILSVSRRTWKSGRCSLTSSKQRFTHSKLGNDVVAYTRRNAWAVAMLKRLIAGNCRSPGRIKAKDSRSSGFDARPMAFLAVLAAVSLALSSYLCAGNYYVAKWSAQVHVSSRSASRFSVVKNTRFVALTTRYYVHDVSDSFVLSNAQ